MDNYSIISNIDNNIFYIEVISNITLEKYSDTFKINDIYSNVDKIIKFINNNNKLPSSTIFNIIKAINFITLSIQRHDDILPIDFNIKLNIMNENDNTILNRKLSKYLNEIDILKQQNKIFENLIFFMYNKELQKNNKELQKNKKETCGHSMLIRVCSHGCGKSYLREVIKYNLNDKILLYLKEHKIDELLLLIDQIDIWQTNDIMTLDWIPENYDKSINLSSFINLNSINGLSNLKNMESIKIEITISKIQEAKFNLEIIKLRQNNSNITFKII
jgi:hypothetical protein